VEVAHRHAIRYYVSLSKENLRIEGWGRVLVAGGLGGPDCLAQVRSKAAMQRHARLQMPRTGLGRSAAKQASKQASKSVTEFHKVHTEFHRVDFIWHRAMVHARSHAEEQRGAHRSFSVKLCTTNLKNPRGLR
jgi:hypothetical protein